MQAEDFRLTPWVPAFLPIEQDEVERTEVPRPPKEKEHSLRKEEVVIT